MKSKRLERGKKNVDSWICKVRRMGKKKKKKKVECREKKKKTLRKEKNIL